MKRFLDSLRDYGLDNREYGRDVDENTCTRCGAEIDPAYDMFRLCDRCAREIEQEVKAFYRAYDKYELEYLEDLGMNNMPHDFAGRPAYAPEYV